MVLYRRTSSQISERKQCLSALSRAQSLCRTASIPTTPLFSSPSPRLPVELLDKIVEIAYQDAQYAQGNTFEMIAPLALGCSMLRELVFRHCLRTLDLTSFTQWSSRFKLLLSLDASGSGGFRSVKSIIAQTKTLITGPRTRLAMFTNVCDLSLTFATEGLSTQHLSVKTIFTSLSNIKHTLTFLTLTSLPRIDLSLLRLIASNFPKIRNMWLGCVERINFSCCWYCLEESLRCSDQFPVPDRYLEAKNMAHAFSDALRPLSDLTHLHLGIFVGSEDGMVDHADHARRYDEQPEVSSSPSRSCAECADFEEETRMAELEASLIMAQTMKSLQTIGWSSFFAKGADDDDEEDDDSDPEQEQPAKDLPEDLEGPAQSRRPTLVEEGAGEMRTKVWIMRADGRVRVRRSPW